MSSDSPTPNSRMPWYGCSKFSPSKKLRKNEERKVGRVVSHKHELNLFSEVLECYSLKSPQKSISRHKLSGAKEKMKGSSLFKVKQHIFSMDTS